MSKHKDKLVNNDNLLRVITHIFRVWSQADNSIENCFRILAQLEEANYLRINLGFSPRPSSQVINFSIRKKDLIRSIRRDMDEATKIREKAADQIAVLQATVVEDMGLDVIDVSEEQESP